MRIARMLRGVSFHELVKKAKEFLVHRVVVVRAQSIGLLHEPMVGQPCQLLLVRCYQQLDNVNSELHVTLETVDEVAVFNDLTRTSLAVGDDFGAVCQARHIAVPVSGVHAVAKVRELAICLALGRQHDGKLTNLLFRAVLVPDAQCLADQLCTQADADYAEALGKISPALLGKMRPSRLHDCAHNSAGLA
jgi:hypothetical protein